MRGAARSPETEAPPLSQRVLDAAMGPASATDGDTRSVAGGAVGGASAAKAGLAGRVGRVVAGSVVLVLGVILIPLPGPGLGVIAVGLAMLSRDVRWAGRTMHYVRARVPEQRPPWPVMVASSLPGIVVVGLTFWWMLLR